MDFKSSVNAEKRLARSQPQRAPASRPRILHIEKIECAMDPCPSSTLRTPIKIFKKKENCIHLATARKVNIQEIYECNEMENFNGTWNMATKLILLIAHFSIQQVRLHAEGAMRADEA